jgi:NAD(P) transhydrogenase subunit alpha
MYAKNIATFLKYLVKDGKLELNQQDEIVKETLVIHEGKVVHQKIGELLGVVG